MSEVKGSIIHIGETETVGSAGTFKKRLVVVKSDEQYPQEIPVDFVQDKTSMLDQFKIGDDVNVSINIRGNAYNGKWYVNLQGWKISKITDANNTEVHNAEVVKPIINDGQDEENDLPF